MNHKIIFLTWLISITTTLASGCKKNKLSELDKLPLATQTGAKTFGCLINGKAWIPGKDDWSSQSPLKFYYYNDNGGQFAINAKLQINNIQEYIIIGLDSIHSKNEFIIKQGSNSVRLSYQRTPGCDLSSLIDSSVQTIGSVTFTKVDLNTGIIAGTFAFSLSKPGRETINVTNGRFDAKL